MLCCALLIAVLGLVREAWFLLPGTTRPPEPGFAPVARRPAPGSSMPATVATPTTVATAAASPGRVATALLLVALGTVTYAVVVYLLLLLGLAQARTGSAYLWLARDVLLGMLALSAAALAARRPRPTRRVPSRQVQGSALAGLGSAWFLLGVADMHAFSLLEVGGGSLAADLVFHGSGAVLVLAGALLLSARAPHPQRRATRTERILHVH